MEPAFPLLVLSVSGSVWMVEEAGLALEGPHTPMAAWQGGPVFWSPKWY